jgi:hypothetical protein
VSAREPLVVEVGCKSRHTFTGKPVRKIHPLIGTRQHPFTQMHQKRELLLF